MKSISESQLLEKMAEGKEYSRATIAGLSPDVEPRIIYAALAVLVRRGDVWNANTFTYIKFAKRNIVDSIEPQQCAANKWEDLKGYGASLRSAIAEPVSRRS